MSMQRIRMMVVGFCLLTGLAKGSENLCANGSFDDAGFPLKGWICDYQWAGNSHYMSNHEKVAAQPRVAGRATVATITATSDAGAKMECRPIPFEPGYRYTCTMKIRGGPSRIYFAGYKWKPGIRPHEDPELGELRTLYKSKAYTGAAKGWETITLKLPGVEMSELAYKHLSPVRFITLYVWTLGALDIDDVVITRTEDRSLKL